MSSVAELILKIVGKDETGAATKSAAAGLKEFGNNAQKASLAVSAAGVGIEALARSQQESNALVQQNAAALGMSEGEYRKLATSIANAGFPLDEVNQLIMTGRQEGLESADALKEYANFWDLVGDATGESATKLGESATGLRAVGIAAGEEGKAIKALGFLTDNTKMSTEDFLGILTKKGAALKDFGIDIDDTASVLGAMEKNLGLTGRAAATEFEQAMERSDGTLEGLLRELGLTNDQFAAMRDQVEQSGGVLERNAAIVDANITPAQKLKQAFDEFMFSQAGVIRGAAQFAPIMMAAGPAVTGLTTAMRLMGPASTIAAGGLRAVGMALLTPPLGIVIAIAAVLVAVYIFRDDIMAVFRKVAAVVVPLVKTVSEDVVGAFQAILDFGKEHWPEIVTIISGPFFPLVALATDAFGIRSAIVGAFDAILEKATGWGGSMVSFLTSFPGEAAAGFGDGFGFLWDSFKSAVNMIIRGWNALSFKLPGFDPPGPGPKFPGITINTPDIPLLASGGIVTKPTLAMIGDGGPEAVIPLDKASGLGGIQFNGPITVVNQGATKDPRGTLRDVAFAIAAELRSRGMMVPA